MNPRIIDPGDYPHFLQFEKKDIPAVLDAIGGEVETWTCAFKSWGAFEPIGGREFPQSQKRQAETTARFRIPYRSDVTVDKHRIKHNSQTWNIESVMPMPAGVPVELHIEASEIK